jgi:hypothetical protein
MKYIQETISDLAVEYEFLFNDSRWVVYSGISVWIIVVAYVINQVAGQYATARARGGIYIHDVLLDAFPRFEVDSLHIAGGTFLIACTLLMIFLRPKYLPFALSGVALVSLTRSVFINMTHLGLYRDAPFLSGSYTFGGDLFFSGHVAIPFMLALVFWKIETMRYVFFWFSVVLGSISLLGHHHYSIDIFAAPFISYGLYALLIRTVPFFCAMARDD